MKKVISFAVALLVSITAVSGCSQQNRSNDKKSETKSFIYKTNDTGLINENEYFVDLNISDDKLMLTKSIRKKLVELNSYDIENGKTETHLLDCSDFEYDLSENTSLISDDENYYLLDSNSRLSVIYTINKENDEISCLNLPEKNVEKIFADGSGALYISYNEYDIRKQHSYIEKYVNNEKKESFDVAEVISGGSMTAINDIYVDENQNIYVLYTVNNTVCIARMNMKGEIASKAEAEGIFGRMNHIAVSGQNDIFVVNCDEQNIILLNRINSDTCETTDLYEEKKDSDSILSGAAGYDYIIEKNNEFIGVKAESGEYEKLLSNIDNSDINYVWKNELTFFNVRFEYSNILVKAEKNTSKMVSEYPLEIKSDCYIIDSVYKDDEHIYLCENNEEQLLLFTDNDGKTKNEILLGSVAEKRYQHIDTDQDNNIYLVSMDSDKCYYQKFDKDMKLLDEMSDDNFKGVSKLVCVGEDLYSYNLDGILYQVDFINKKLNEKDIGMPVFDIYSYDEKLMVKDDSGIIYMFENDDMTEIFNVNELSQIRGNNVSEITFDGTNDFFIFSDIDNIIYKVDKINVSDIDDAKVINVAYDISSSEIKNVIANFYSENDNVIIKLSDYSTDEQIEKLNIEFANGNVPDIIISDGRIDMSVYENLNALEDLSGFIEKDETINSDDYYMNIFKACSSNGKITQIVPFYSVITGFGKTSVLGNNMGWDYSEFLEKVSANKDKDILYKGLFYNGVPYIDVLYFTLSSLIDFQSKKFDSDEKITDVLSAFKPYLNYAIDENSDYDKSELADDFDMRFRDNKVLFDIADIRDIESICCIKDAVINDDIVLKGLPSNKSNGSYVNPGLRIAMLTSCKEKNAAWEFIRQFLSDEYQDEKSKSYLPVKKSVMKKMFDRCEESKYNLGNEVCDVHVPSQREKAMINEWLESLSASVVSENRITSIIYRELNRYLNGEWNEDETIKEIKRKIEMYLSEV